MREGDVRFKVTCNLSHTLPDDPIVHPGQPGASHLHEFFGNTTTSASSTTASLAAGTTTCNDPGDLGAYWQPTLYVTGVRRDPGRMTAYYRLGDKHPPINAWPQGLRMVASTGEWECNGVGSSTPIGCAGELKGRVTFPDCWDGRQLDSADHRSHLAYSVFAQPANVCPPDHPVPTPALSTYTNYGTVAAGDVLTLSSGPVSTWHGDFINLWNGARLSALICSCLDAFQFCASGA